MIISFKLRLKNKLNSFNKFKKGIPNMTYMIFYAFSNTIKNMQLNQIKIKKFIILFNKFFYIKHFFCSLYFVITYKEVSLC